MKKWPCYFVTAPKMAGCAVRHKKNSDGGRDPGAENSTELFAANCKWGEQVFFMCMGALVFVRCRLLH